MYIYFDRQIVASLRMILILDKAATTCKLGCLWLCPHVLRTNALFFYLITNLTAGIFFVFSEAAQAFFGVYMEKHFHSASFTFLF